MLDTIFGFAKEVLPFAIDLAKDSGAFLTTPAGAGIGFLAAVTGYFLKQADNKKTKGVILWPFKWLGIVLEKIMFGFGVTITAGASKWPLTAGIWNKTVEPFFVDLLDNLFNSIIDGLELVVDGIRKGLFDGLHSDNK